jgi:hypothetical protein
MLRNFDLPMTLEHIENNSQSLKFYLQKIGFKENRTNRRTKIGFKSRFAKGESRARRRRMNIKHTS